MVSTGSAPGSVLGLVYYSSVGRQSVPWGNGTSFQCVAPPVTRAGVLQSAGTPGACDGVFSQDINAFWCPSCPKPGKAPEMGSIVRLQLWYRDPQNTSNQQTALTDALEFGVGG